MLIQVELETIFVNCLDPDGPGMVFIENQQVIKAVDQIAAVMEVREGRGMQPAVFRQFLSATPAVLHLTDEVVSTGRHRRPSDKRQRQETDESPWIESQRCQHRVENFQRHVPQEGCGSYRVAKILWQPFDELVQQPFDRCRPVRLRP